MYSLSFVIYVQEFVTSLSFIFYRHLILKTDKNSKFQNTMYDSAQF